MVLTKEDLLEWNNNPVTKEIFSLIQSGIEEIKSQPTFSTTYTVDKIALGEAFKEGYLDGCSSLFESYEDALEGAD